MKKRLLIFVYLILSSISFSQAPAFNIQYSEQLAVFVFVQELSENHPDNVFKEAFKNSKFNTEENQKLIAKMDALSIDYSYLFDEYPYSTKSPMQTIDILKKYLIETKNLSEFKKHAIGILPLKTLINMSEIIEVFTPIYNEIIYNPNKDNFEKQIVEIRKYAIENHFETYFNVGLIFYNASWDKTVPFEIAFYPLPNENGFTAQAFYNNFISAIQTNMTDYIHLFSVMLHETYHILYDEQSLELKLEIDTFFKENKSKCSNYAYLLLNEALATALGNGYVYEQLAGELESQLWYNRKYTNLLAREIYPLVKEYILQKKAIDKDFIDNYIRLYELKYASWIDELQNFMTYRYILSENEEDYQSIQKLYRYRSIDEFETEISVNSINKMKKTPLTKVIIISKNNKQKLKMVKDNFNELIDWKYNPSKEFSFKILLEDKSQLLIINQKESSIESLFNELK